jgi:tryptophan synthase alpha subunit
VNRVDIKIVGLISDDDEFDEIHSIAKVFIYTQRMKGFTYEEKDNNLIAKTYLKNYKKINKSRKSNYFHLTQAMVRGLA